MKVKDRGKPDPTENVVVWEHDRSGSLILHLPPYTVTLTIAEIVQVAKYWDCFKKTLLLKADLDRAGTDARGPCAGRVDADPGVSGDR
jgi:hypothetical protein